jgi:hypothetical protein
VVAQAAGVVIHEGWTVERALEAQEAWRGQRMSEIAEYLI